MEKSKLIVMKELGLRKLVDEIVNIEIKRPIIEAIVSVFDDQKYQTSLKNYEQRLSTLYEEINRRDKLYNS